MEGSGVDEKRAASDTKDKPFNIYEVHLGSWIRKAFAEDEMEM